MRQITHRLQRAAAASLTAAALLLGSAAPALAVTSIGTDVSTDGNLTGNGNVVLGNALTDVITITGNVAISDTQWSISAAGVFTGDGSGLTNVGGGAIGDGSVTAKKLQTAAADLGAADVNVNLGNTNGAFNTNLTIDGALAATGLNLGNGSISNLGVSGASLTRAGAHALTLTTTGATDVTLPTSGTLVSSSNNLSVFAATSSAQLLGVLNDETGTGLAVFGTSPTLVTPTLGAATATSLNGLVVTPSLGTLTIANNASAALVTSGNFSITLTATGATNVTLPTTGTLATRLGAETLSNKTFRGDTVFEAGAAVATDDQIGFAPVADGFAARFVGAFVNMVDLTAARSYGLQNASGTVALGTLANSLFFTTTGATTVTLPTTGTLATLAGTETLTNKQLGNLKVSSQAFDAAGTNDTTPEWTGEPVVLLGFVGAQFFNLGACASNPNKIVTVRVKDTGATARTINGTNTEGIVPFIGGAKADFTMQNNAAADTVTAQFYCDGTDWVVLQQTKR